MTEISEKIIEILSDLSGIDKKQITLESDLEQDLGLDSLSLTEAAIKIEDLYDLGILDLNEIYPLSLDKMIGNQDQKPVYKLTDYVQKQIDKKVA